MPNFDMFLTDFHALSLPKAYVCDAAGREYALDSAIDTLKGPKLKVQIRATSSGKFINGRVYPGPRVMDSTASWLQPYAKPALDRHPGRSLFGPAGPEPTVLGRALDAKYTRTADKQAWMRDWHNPMPGNSEGTGFITLDTEVTEESAVRAILDNRLLTVSQGSRPSNFFCSICKKDWMADGPCDHEPGKTYEVDTKGKKGKFLAFGVTGNLDYDHIAFVNTPADSTAQTLNVAVIGDASRTPTAFTIPSDRIPECELLSLVLTDAAGTASLEMQIGDDPFTYTSSSTTSIYTMGTTEPKVVHPPKLEAVVDLDAEVGLHKEIIMGDENTPTEGQPAETPKPAETPAEAPAEKPAEAAPAEAPADPPAEGGAEGEAESTPAAGATDGNNWTQPDPEDGHTHKLTSLDENGDGEVAKNKGHNHQVRGGRVLPTNMDGGLSRHPGTFFFDDDGVVQINLEDAEDDSSDTGTADQKGAATMSNTETVDNISPTVLNTLSAEIDTLKAEKTRLESTIDDQNAELTAHREQVDTLTEDKRKQLADRVVDLMLMLGKPQARDANTPEKLQALRDETAKREMVSLTDTAQDLQLELAQGNGSGIRPGLQTEPVTSDVPGRGASPTADSGEEAGKGKPTLKEKLKARLQGK
jgi:hypothetical protein